MFERSSGSHFLCFIQFHSAIEEFNKALLEKKYVDAANHLERVSTTLVISVQPLLQFELGQWVGAVARNN